MRKIFNVSLWQSWAIGVLVCLVFWGAGLPSGPQPVLAAEPASQAPEPAPLLLQGVVSPTATVPLTATVLPSVQASSSSGFNFTLADLGYEETILVSPYDAVIYSFRLPQSWTIQNNNFVVLDLSYTYSQVAATELPAVFGELRVVFDGRILGSISIDKQWAHQPFRFELPVDLLSTENREHSLELIFNADFLCGVAHRANLLVYPTTLFSLNRTIEAPALDLARYPLPIYQRSSFGSDSVYFVLSTTPTETELKSALGMAAKLGDLTSNNLAISATTDVELSDVLSSLAGGMSDHLIVVGRPQNNQMISALNQYLPVSSYQRRFEISAERPGFVAPGEVITYTYTVSNTTDEAVTLSVAGALSAQAQLQNCSPRCAGDAATNAITWQNVSLGPGETLNLWLSVKASPTLSGTLFENVTTFSQGGKPVNAATLTSTIVAALPDSNSPQPVAYKEGDYFFAYNGQAVAETDGIVQEIISPWDKNRVILVVTGLDDLALSKAGYAMSSDSKFPGMKGPVAFVEDVVLPPEENQEVPAIFELTLEQLGYADRTIKGNVIGEIEYRFNVPYGWVLADGSFVELYFTHSQLIRYEASGLTVLINDVPVASAAFTNQSATGGYLNVKLTNSNIRQGRVNRLTLQGILSLDEKCLSQELVESRAWLIVSNQSKVRLVRNQEAKVDFNLSYYPNPFYARPDLSDLLFALPARPASGEWGYALRLASSLGSSAKGKTMIPGVTAGDTLPAETELAKYNIIALGQPSRNPLLQNVSAWLPLPLSPITNQPEQKLDHIKFRLSPDLQLGYIELIPSPWNENRALLTVMGDTGTGLKEAVGVLVSRPWSVEGNLSVVKDDVPNNIDTRLLTSGGFSRSLTTFLETEGLAITGTTVLTGLEEVTPATSTSPLPTPLQTDNLPVDVVPDGAGETFATPVWVIPLVVVTALIVVMIFSFAFWQSRRRK